jgi:hypothetical protein
LFTHAHRSYCLGMEIFVILIRICKQDDDILSIVKIECAASFHSVLNKRTMVILTSTDIPTIIDIHTYSLVYKMLSNC